MYSWRWSINICDLFSVCSEEEEEAESESKRASLVKKEKDEEEEECASREKWDVVGGCHVLPTAWAPEEERTVQKIATAAGQLVLVAFVG